MTCKGTDLNWEVIFFVWERTDLKGNVLFFPGKDLIRDLKKTF